MIIIIDYMGFILLSLKYVQCKVVFFFIGQKNTSVGKGTTLGFAHVVELEV